MIDGCLYQRTGGKRRSGMRCSGGHADIRNSKRRVADRILNFPSMLFIFRDLFTGRHQTVDGGMNCPGLLGNKCVTLPFPFTDQVQNRRLNSAGG